MMKAPAADGLWGQDAREASVAQQSISRRKALGGAGAAATALAFAPRVLAQAPPGEAITPALIQAATKEGRVNLYTAMEIATAEQYSKVFEAKFSGDLGPRRALGG
jgi:iron(III) transport system substrate-binding protein